MKETRGKRCYGVVAKDGADVGPSETFQCDKSECQKEYPEGTKVYYACEGKNQDECPANKTDKFAVSCEKPKFNRGCTVKFKEVSDCSNP